MTVSSALLEARSALATVVTRYHAMGWFEPEYPDKLAEAESMESALEAGDEIAVGVALDHALERFDGVGAFECPSCGCTHAQLVPESNDPCLCVGSFAGHTEASECLDIQTALEFLRTPVRSELGENGAVAR